MGHWLTRGSLKRHRSIVAPFPGPVESYVPGSCQFFSKRVKVGVNAGLEVHQLDIMQIVIDTPDASHRKL